MALWMARLWPGKRSACFFSSREQPGPSITGIIAFGSKAVKFAAQIRESGSSAQLGLLGKAADDLNKTADFILSEGFLSSTPGTLPTKCDEPDQGIILLAYRSVEIGHIILSTSTPPACSPPVPSSMNRARRQEQSLRIKTAARS